MRRTTTALLIAALIVASGTLGPAQAAQLQWWSHWEPSRREQEGRHARGEAVF